jgi:hypothetical protein
LRGWVIKLDLVRKAPMRAAALVVRRLRRTGRTGNGTAAVVLKKIPAMAHPPSILYGLKPALRTACTGNQRSMENTEVNPPSDRV